MSSQPTVIRTWLATVSGCTPVFIRIMKAFDRISLGVARCTPPVVDNFLPGHTKLVNFERVYLDNEYELEQTDSIPALTLISSIV